MTGICRNTATEVIAVNWSTLDVYETVALGHIRPHKGEVRPLYGNANVCNINSFKKYLHIHISFKTGFHKTSYIISDVSWRNPWTFPEHSPSPQCTILFSLLSSVSVLIGAPKANTSQPDITEGGAVFLCPGSQANCSMIDFDKQGRRSC